MKKSRALSLLAGIVVLLTAVGCGSSSGSDPTGGDGPTVVATTTQLADFARNVVGENGRVIQILDANADAHDFEPTSDHLKAVTDADVIIVNGLHLDDWINDLRTSSGSTAPVVVASRGITPLRIDDEDDHAEEGDHAHEDDHDHTDGDDHADEPAAAHDDDHDHGPEDPHVWMDPANAKIMVTTIEKGIAAAAPDHAEQYAANAEAYRGELAELERELDALIAQVPPAQRRIVTDHDAFGYLTTRYGITTVGTILPSLSTSSEPSAKDIAALAAEVKRANVRVIFPEAAISPKLSEALAKETGATIGAVLYADSLGPEGSGAETYIGMMKSNMTALVEGMKE